MKKESIIRQLLMDGPCSMATLKKNEAQQRLTDKLIEAEKEIGAILGDEALESFKKYLALLDDLYFEETCSCFEKGLKFGVLFGMELAEK